MFGDIDYDRLPPAEEEVAESCPYQAGQTQPSVVGHEDEHQEVRDKELQHMQHRLQQVFGAPHAHAAEEGGYRGVMW